MSVRPTTSLPAYDLEITDSRADSTLWRRGIAPCFAVFALGSIAQGAPFVLVAATLESRDVGSGWLAAVAAARLAPYLVCSPLAGAVAGRYEAPGVFAITGAARGAVIVALGISVSTAAPAGVLLLLLFALVAFGTPGFPALMRVVHHIARPAQLDRASTLAAGLESAAFCVGPALGGVLLLGVTDAAGALLVCAAMMLASAVLARRVVIESGTRHPPDADPVLHPWQDPALHPGLDRLPDRRIRTAGRRLLDSRIRPAVVAVLGVNVLAGLDAALLVRLPEELDLHDERALGLMSFALGLGAFAAFVVLVGSARRSRRPLLPLVTASVSVAVLAATSEVSVAVMACLVLGASILTSEALATSALGRSLPATLVAQAFGVLDALMVAAMIAGAALAPLLTVAVGMRPTLVVAGVGTPLLAMGVLHLCSASRHDRRIER